MLRSRRLMLAALFSAALMILVTSGPVLAHDGEHAAESKGFQYTNELLIGVGVAGVVVASGVGYWLHRRRAGTP